MNIPPPRGVAGMQMQRLTIAFAVLVAAVAFAGCTAEGASERNFTLTPQKVGWYMGEEAHFVLNLAPSFGRSSPSYTLDRNFAIEEIRFDEQGAKFGGDFETRDPDSIDLRLVQAGATLDELTLRPDTPSVDIFLKVPDDLRDSEYVLEIKLFTVGWVESAPFRVDEK